MSGFNMLKQQKKIVADLDRARKTWICELVKIQKRNESLIIQSLNKLGKILDGTNLIFSRKYSVQSEWYENNGSWILRSKKMNHEDVGVFFNFDYDSENMAAWKSWYNVGWLRELEEVGDTEVVEVIISTSDLNENKLEAALTKVINEPGFKN